MKDLVKKLQLFLNIANCKQINFNVLLLFQSQNGICINHKQIPKREYVALGNNDIISFVPSGSADYRYVYAGTLQVASIKLEFGSSPPMVPSQSKRINATKTEFENAAQITGKRIKVEADWEQTDQHGSQLPQNEDGSSSVWSADTEILPEWMRSPALYFPDVSFAILKTML